MQHVWFHDFEQTFRTTKVFGQYLREYCNKILIQKLPGAGKSSATSTFSQVTAMLKDDAGTKLSRHELSVACLLLNSADYCLDTISALEQKLVEKADPEFKDRIGKLLLQG